MVGLDYILNRLKEPTTYAGLAIAVVPISQAIAGKTTLELFLILGFALIAVLLPEGLATKTP